MNKLYKTVLPKLFLCALALATSFDGFAQSGVGIGTTTPQAALDVSSTTGGFLPPRMSLEQRGKLAPLVEGLIIYQEDNEPGLYLYNGQSWVSLGADHLGNHNATQRLNLRNQLLVGTDVQGDQPGAQGLRINGMGQVGIGSISPTRPLQLGDRNFTSPSFLKIGVGNGIAQREWELGVDINKNNVSDVSGENYDFAIRDATGDATRLLIDYTNGNVGIGNSIPSEKLEVNGNVKVSDRIEAEQFKYITTKTRELTVPLTAFTSCEPSLYHANLNLVSNDLRGTSAKVPSGLSITGGSGGEGFLSAPIYLPQFAVVISITLIGEFIDIVGRRPMGMALLGMSPTNRNSVFEAEVFVGPHDFSGNSFIKITTEQTNHVVRNDLYSYQLIATMFQNNSVSRIVGVKITYTVSQPD